MSVMEIDVGGGEQAVMENVETVEVVASGDDISIPASSGDVGLMNQHMMVTNSEGILVPTSEVRNFLSMTAGYSCSSIMQ